MIDSDKAEIKIYSLREQIAKVAQISKELIQNNSNEGEDITWTSIELFKENGPN